MAKPVMLVIRDGWGINPGGAAQREDNGDATLLAHTPFHDQLYREYPMSKLSASGLDVGLPGRADGKFRSRPPESGCGPDRISGSHTNKQSDRGRRTRAKFRPAGNLRNAQGPPAPLARVGFRWRSAQPLKHLVALANAAQAAGVNDILVHAFTDGRDTSPTGGADFSGSVRRELTAERRQIATVDRPIFRDGSRPSLGSHKESLGRGCARPRRALSVTPGRGRAEKNTHTARPMNSCRRSSSLTPNEQRIRDGDTVLFFNFRADRARQLSQAFLLEDFDGFDREVWPRVHYVTLTQYDVTYPVPVHFRPEELTHILGEVVSAAGKTQLRIAETEKYPHVTYFFNGGVERAFPGRRSQDRPVPEGRHLRSAAGDERARSDR